MTTANKIALIAQNYGEVSFPALQYYLQDPLRWSAFGSSSELELKFFLEGQYQDVAQYLDTHWWTGQLHLS